jgi:hypothetical protein
MQKSMTQALGSQKWLSLTQYSRTSSCLQALKSEGYRIVATDLGDTSTAIGDLECCRFTFVEDGSNDSSSGGSTAEGGSDSHVNNSGIQDSGSDYKSGSSSSQNDKNRKIAIVMGSEKTGISAEMRAMADELFHIPMKGFAESFNLAAASAITCAYLDAMGALKPSLSPYRKRRILLTWLARSVDGSMPLLRKAGLDVGKEKKPPYAVICGVNARP